MFNTLRRAVVVQDEVLGPEVLSGRSAPIGDGASHGDQVDIDANIGPLLRVEHAGGEHCQAGFHGVLFVAQALLPAAPRLISASTRLLRPPLTQFLSRAAVFSSALQRCGERILNRLACADRSLGPAVKITSVTNPV